MNNVPYWETTARIPRYPRLNGEQRVDVAVIGGGVTGISIAYLLKQAGATVALLERQRCASVDTGHTTAHLTYVTDMRLRDLISQHGKPHAQAVWDAGQAALHQIGRQVNDEKIDCEFIWVPVFLHTSLRGHDDKKDARELKQDAQTAAKLGFDAVYLDAVPWMKRPGIRFANQAKFHPRKYLAGLLRAFEGKGCQAFENTEAGEIKEKPMRVVTEYGVVRCKDVIIATNVPLQGTTGTVSAMLFQSKLSAYSSYVLGAKIPRGQAPEASFWDTTDPYYYLRIDAHRTHDYAIFGGEDHKTGQVKNTEQCYRRLEKMFRRILPEAKIDHRWSGQIIETNDGLPYIGPTAPHQYVATGFCGNGMTFATVAALLMRDTLTGRRNPWTELFHPERKKLRAAWHYLKENKDYPFYLLKDQIAKAEGTSLRSLKRKQGRVLKLNGQKVAAYRDEHGKVTLCSAVCTHMGCLVDWNEAERTWDCPCHGSRFKPTGEVLAGPAEDDLEKVE